MFLTIGILVRCSGMRLAVPLAICLDHRGRSLRPRNGLALVPQAHMARWNLRTDP